MVKEVTKSKVKKRLEDVLRCMVNGILRNSLITPMIAMVFCKEFLNIDTDEAKPIKKEKLVCSIFI